ncbi:ABC transporter permease [Ornithinibacillus scapharcae]|uniref:ABC transporter permease n=1 Tax=Ornithinibacillus scapharcae TaxID=1147159 RepID=UPI000225BBC8|nr:ABC transporter permease [Ornithinibacillus scapharcae]
MTFRQFAFRNVARNKRLYAAYYLSSLFTVMVFFTFSIFAFHPELSGDGMNSSVRQGMNISSGIIYVFSFFFILYSMSSFLQSRKREFGLLMIQGMSMKQIRMMVFLENTIIGIAATISGILLGLVFAKFILLVAENVLVLEGGLDFYFPVQAIVITFISFVILFFIISIFVSYVLRSRKLIELIKSNKKSKGEPKANIFLTILAILLLGSGYVVALLVEGVMVITAMLPVIIVVTIGTYLLFTQLSVYVIGRLKSNKSIFWRRTNMILLSDLSFRMKDNARTFFLVAIISTVAFSAIGTLFGFQTTLTSELKKSQPNSVTFTSEEDEEDNKSLINKKLEEANIETKQANGILNYYRYGDNLSLIANESDFNRFSTLIGEDPIEVNDGEIVVVEFTGSNYGETDELLQQEVLLTSGEKLKANDVIYSKALPAQDSYYVVSDHDHSKLPKPEFKDYYTAWHVMSGESGLIKVAEELYEEIPVYKLFVLDYRIYSLNKQFASVLFVGLFIGIVFFVSAGSFLYFRLYTDLDEDKQKFKAIMKMGLTEKELSKVLSRQIALLFFTPIIVAIVHGAVALTALSNLFYHNLADVSAIVLGVFLAIQIIYYFIVRYFYTRQIKAVL